jgi:murein DD-endopeptidase MepM/ murein hydrolase activator NlpD
MLKKSLKLFLAAMLFVLSTQGGVFAQDAKFRSPLNGGSTICAFNSTTCYSRGKYHSGLDMSSTDKNIYATNAGKIVAIVPNDLSTNNADHNMGNSIIVEHKAINPQGATEILYSSYSHLESFSPGLYVNEAVTKGEKLGVMGKTGGESCAGGCWGVHLHFEIKRAPVLHNPSGSGQYWGYMPGSAVDYGYIDPAWVVSPGGLTANSNDYAYWEFSGASNYEGWSLMNWAGWSVNGGTLFIDPSGNDPHIKSPELFVDASVLKYLKFSMASNAPDANGQIFFKTASENDYHPDNKTINFIVQNNGQFKDYSIQLTHPKWTGKITGVRIDPANAGVGGTNADTIGWHWIRLSQNP